MCPLLPWPGQAEEDAEAGCRLATQLDAQAAAGLHTVPSTGCAGCGRQNLYTGPSMGSALCRLQNQPHLEMQGTSSTSKPVSMASGFSAFLRSRSMSFSMFSLHQEHSVRCTFLLEPPSLKAVLTLAPRPLQGALYWAGGVRWCKVHNCQQSSLCNHSICLLGCRCRLAALTSHKRAPQE